MWYKVAQEQMQSVAVTRDIVPFIRNEPFFKKLFAHYGVDFKDLWKITFHVADLDGALAQTKGDDIYLDRKLMQRPMEENLHLIAHELSHWLTRQREKVHYFSDPEEIKGFSWGIACELARGKDINHILQVFTPLVAQNMPADKVQEAILHMIRNARSLSK